MTATSRARSRALLGLASLALVGALVLGRPVGAQTCDPEPCETTSTTEEPTTTTTEEPTTTTEAPTTTTTDAPPTTTTTTQTTTTTRPTTTTATTTTTSPPDSPPATTTTTVFRPPADRVDSTTTTTTRPRTTSTSTSTTLGTRTTRATPTITTAPTTGGSAAGAPAAGPATPPQPPPASVARIDARRAAIWRWFFRTTSSTEAPSTTAVVTSEVASPTTRPRPGDPAATSVDRATIDAVLASDEAVDAGWLGISNLQLALLVVGAGLLVFVVEEVRHRVMTRR